MRNRNFSIFLFLFFFSYLNCAYAKKTIEHTEKYDSKRIWLAIPVGGFVGFGLGHTIQERYAEYAWVFTGVDAAAVLFGLFYNFGDCAPQDSTCKDQRTQKTNAATAVWAVSRLVQVSDLSIWSYKYYNRFNSSAYFTPTKAGVALNLVMSF